MSSKKTYHHGDLRQALIDTAIALVAEQGINNWSLREVARRIGVSHTAPYRHFADRDALLAAVGEKGFQELCEHLQQTLRKMPAKILNRPDARLQAIGIAYVQYAIAHPCEYEVMFRYSPKDESQYPALTQTGKKAFAILVNEIAIGQKASVFRQENPTELALVAWSLVHGLSMLAIDGQLEIPEGKTIDAIANFTTQILNQGMVGD
jgi:AcrR family transcriptional regulator